MSENQIVKQVVEAMLKNLEKGKIVGPILLERLRDLAMKGEMKNSEVLQSVLRDTDEGSNEDCQT